MGRLKPTPQLPLRIRGLKLNVKWGGWDNASTRSQHEELLTYEARNSCMRVRR